MAEEVRKWVVGDRVRDDECVRCHHSIFFFWKTYILNKILCTILRIHVGRGRLTASCT